MSGEPIHYKLLILVYNSRLHNVPYIAIYHCLNMTRISPFKDMHNV